MELYLLQSSRGCTYVIHPVLDEFPRPKPRTYMELTRITEVRLLLFHLIALGPAKMGRILEGGELYSNAIKRQRVSMKFSPVK